MLISRYDRLRINYYRRCINLRIFRAHYLGKLDSLLDNYIQEINRLKTYLHNKEMKDADLLFQHLHYVVNFLHLLSLQKRLTSSTGKNVQAKIQHLIFQIKQLLTWVLMDLLEDDSLDEVLKLPTFQRELLVEHKIAEILKDVNELEEE